MRFAGAVMPHTQMLIGKERKKEREHTRGVGLSEMSSGQGLFSVQVWPASRGKRIPAYFSLECFGRRRLLLRLRLDFFAASSLGSGCSCSRKRSSTDMRVSCWLLALTLVGVCTGEVAGAGAAEGAEESRAC